MARAEAIIKMSIHGKKIRGKKRQHNKEFWGQLKEICPLCNHVQQYLSIHLRRHHKLDNE